MDLRSFLGRASFTGANLGAIRANSGGLGMPLFDGQLAVPIIEGWPRPWHEPSGRAASMASPGSPSGLLSSGTSLVRPVITSCPSACQAVILLGTRAVPQPGRLPRANPDRLRAQVAVVSATESAGHPHAPSVQVFEYGRRSPPTWIPYPTGMPPLLGRRIAVLARLAGDATELVQSRRWMAVPAAVALSRQQMAALSG